MCINDAEEGVSASPDAYEWESVNYGKGFSNWGRFNSYVPRSLVNIEGQDYRIRMGNLLESELMINPFGNYLMQKLLEVCNEDQRMEILLRVTEEPGELVRISLNTHGNQVVQKLVETLKTRKQISLAIAALEPGFLAIIKDLNGNHVVQRCLQCFTNEYSKFCNGVLLADESR